MMLLSRSIYVLIICLICACKTDSEANMPVIKSMTLVVVDSIGVESGNADQMFGEIRGACFISSGGIVVADGTNQDLRLFTHDGAYETRASNQGSGPLEYTCLGGVAPYGAGIVIYEDYMRHYIYYDATLTPTLSISLPGARPFDQFQVLADSSILTWDTSLEANSAGATLSMRLSSFCQDSANATKVFYEIQQTAVNPEALFQYFIGKPAYATDSMGRVYLANAGNSNCVIILAEDGTPLDTLENPRQPGYRDSAEVEDELMWRRHQNGVIGDWLPDPHELGVIGIGVQDSLGRIWVHHSSYFHPKFDVYNLDGTLEYTCTVNGLPGDEMMVFSISDYGILAWSPFPKDWSRVYILKYE